MAFFERPDPRLIQSADPSPAEAVGAALKRDAIGFAVACALVLLVYGANVVAGLHAAAVTRGSAVVRGLQHDVTIVRDRRDIPHVLARTDRDLFMAQGFVEGSDRLFQLDLARRYAYGRLAEVFGRKALALDEQQRAADIAGIARRQWRALAPADRAAIVAFSDGVNAAIATQPLPVEFRLLLYRPAPWRPEDSLAVSIVASLDLADSWHDVFARDAVWRSGGARCFAALEPLTDVRYDVTVDGIRTRRSATPMPNDCGIADVAARRPRRPPVGSNAWAAGSLRSVDGHALVANDPHVDLTIPGIWYAVDLKSPHLHVAGATIPGIPGVVLGHNEWVAWASTNAEMATTSVFRAGRLKRSSWTIERFHVRFERDAKVPYYRTRLDFSVPDDDDRAAVALVRWPVYSQTRSTISTVLALDRARNVGDALRAAARYCGSPQNFIFADRSGAVAYHVAGLVPDDPAWGRYVHQARDLRKTFAPIPFAKLPGRRPRRDAILISANNKPYGTSYPYRLSAQFEPPYRAYRIARLLGERTRYDAAYFARMQLDTVSPIDFEIARDAVRFARRHPSEPGAAELVAQLGAWSGSYDANSRAAALEHALRVELLGAASPLGMGLKELRRGAGVSERGDFAPDLGGTLPLAFDRLPTWRNAGGVRIEHPLSPMHFGFLNGGWLPGEGDEYTIHLQEPGFAQGFRAVWDVGDWDRGGIALPNGESGEPGSGHYTDLTNAWIAGVLEPLPFARGAVTRDAQNVLVLHP